MVRDGLTFREATLELHLALTPIECDAVKNRSEFQDILRDENLKYQTGVGDNLNRTKSSALGMLHLALENLMKEGEYAQVISGIEKLAKIEGWIGGDSTVNVFAGLSARDIDEAKERLKKSDVGRTGDSKTVFPSTAVGNS